MHLNDILDVTIGALIVLEARMQNRPDVSRAVGRALPAVDVLRELAESGVMAGRDGEWTRPMIIPGR